MPGAGNAGSAPPRRQGVGREIPARGMRSCRRSTSCGHSGRPPGPGRWRVPPARVLDPGARGAGDLSHAAVWLYLRAHGAAAARGRTRGAPGGAKPDTAFAQQPNTLWCWDITHLRTTQPWVFLYLYVLLDWVSRKVLARHLAETLESRELLTPWDRGLQKEGLLELPPHVYPRSLSDRGTQMRSRLTRLFLARTGVEALYAQPRTPNDNLEIEPFFSTLKGRLN